MTKPIDPLMDQSAPAASKITPLPEVIGAPPMVATVSGHPSPPNGLALPGAPVTPPLATPHWAAQPLHPMPDEATVPLPVEEVEIGPSGVDDDVEIIDAGAPTPVIVSTTPPPTPAAEAGRAGAADARPPPPPVPARESRPRPVAPPPPPPAAAASA